MVDEIEKRGESTPNEEGQGCGCVVDDAMDEEVLSGNRFSH